MVYEDSKFPAKHTFLPTFSVSDAQENMDPWFEPVGLIYGSLVYIGQYQSQKFVKMKVCEQAGAELSQAQGSFPAKQ